MVYIASEPFKFFSVVHAFPELLIFLCLLWFQSSYNDNGWSVVLVLLEPIFGFLSHNRFPIFWAFCFYFDVNISLLQFTLPLLITSFEDVWCLLLDHRRHHQKSELPQIILTLVVFLHLKKIITLASHFWHLQSIIFSFFHFVFFFLGASCYIMELGKWNNFSTLRMYVHNWLSFIICFRSQCYIFAKAK